MYMILSPSQNTDIHIESDVVNEEIHEIQTINIRVTLNTDNIDQNVFEYEWLCDNCSKFNHINNDICHNCRCARKVDQFEIDQIIQIGISVFNTDYSNLTIMDTNQQYKVVTIPYKIYRNSIKKHRGSLKLRLERNIDKNFPRVEPLP